MDNGKEEIVFDEYQCKSCSGVFYLKWNNDTSVFDNYKEAIFDEYPFIYFCPFCGVNSLDCHEIIN